MRRERDIQGPESLEPNYDLRGMVPGARGFKLNRRDFLKVALVGILAVAANKARNAFDIGISTPESAKTTSTEVVPLIDQNENPNPAFVTEVKKDIPTLTPPPTETSTPIETPTSTPIKKETGLLTPEKVDFLSKHPINHGRTDEKIVMMTYDEGIRPQNVEHLLDLYGDMGAKATFFMTGAGLEQSKELIPRIISEGHTIGSHSWDHINLAELSRNQIAEQFNKWLEKFHSIAPDYRVDYFRAPYGSTNTRVLEIAASFGLQHVLWSVESGGTTPETMTYVFAGLERYLKYYNAEGGAIVLSHTHRNYDISQAQNIIEQWQEMGYVLVTIDEGKMTNDTFR